jgi:hypothetical protein
MSSLTRRINFAKDPVDKEPDTDSAREDVETEEKEERSEAEEAAAIKRLVTSLRKYEEISLDTFAKHGTEGKWKVVEDPLNSEPKRGRLLVEGIKSRVHDWLTADEYCCTLLDEVLLHTRGLVGKSAQDLTETALKTFAPDGDSETGAEVDERRAALHERYPCGFTNMRSSDTRWRKQLKFLEKDKLRIYKWFGPLSDVSTLPETPSNLKEISKAHSERVTTLNHLKTTHELAWPMPVRKTFVIAEDDEEVEELDSDVVADDRGSGGTVPETAMPEPEIISEPVEPAIKKDQIVKDVLSVLGSHLRLNELREAYFRGLAVRMAEGSDGRAAKTSEAGASTV